MSVSKYISIRFSPVCVGESCLGSGRLLGQRAALWPAPVPGFLGEGLLRVCCAVLLSSGAPLRPVQSHSQSMGRHLPSPGFPPPSFYICARVGRRFTRRGPDT